jgi:hypothetical protein
MDTIVTFMTLGQIAAHKGRITKVRWLTGLLYDNNARRVRPGRTLSYMEAEVQGQIVRVHDAPEGLTAFGNTWKKELVNWANERNVYAKSIGLLEEGAQNVY